MCKSEIKKYAVQVNMVRVLQEIYVAQVGTAINTGVPDEFAKAQALLIESKAAEKELDEMTDRILFGKEVANG